MEPSAVWTVESFADPSRSGFKMVSNFLLMRATARKNTRESQRHVERLPCRVSGDDLRKLQEEFGWKLTVVDRGPTMSSYAVAKRHLCAVKNRRIKAWDGEEVIEFDRDLMTMAVKQEGWVHSCRTNASADIAAEYQRQEHTLLKAIEGRRNDIAFSASGLLREIREGGGQHLCLDAGNCQYNAETLLVDLMGVSISATQLAAAMLQHQARRAKVFFFFETDMYVQDEGELTSMNGRYLVDRHADRLFLFPDGQTTVSYGCHYSAAISYLLEPQIVCQGRKFAIEIHDTQPGVVYAQLVLLECEPLEETEVETRFYRPSGQAMTVYEQHWVSPGSTTEQFSRIVVPTSLAERAEGRMMSYPIDKITLVNARIAVQDNTNQGVVRTTTVVSGQRLKTHESELLALAIYKKVLRQRAEIEVEQAHLRTRRKLHNSDYVGWAGAAVSLVIGAGRELLDAVMTLPEEFSVGFSVERDYTVRSYPLDAGFVLRKLVKVRSGVDTAYRSVSYMPGGKRSGSTVSSDSTTDGVLARARAWEVVKDVAAMEDVFYECAQVQEDLGSKAHSPMTQARRDLVEKMCDAYDAHTKDVGMREVYTPQGLSAPLCTVEAVVDEPHVAITEDYLQIFPELRGVDAHVKAHMVSAEDRHVSISAPRVVVNGSYDGIAGTQRVRKPREHTVAEGKRQITQLEGVLAFSKRVANAPRAQLERDFGQMMDSHFDRFQRVCFRSDWKQVVARRYDAGLWAPRRAELERNVHKLETAKVTTMLREFFVRGQVDMSRWKAMVKSVPKPQMSAAAAHEYKATQTIVYQESKMTNSWFSSMLSEFHDVLDEVLKPNVRINVRRDRADCERWFNSWQRRRVVAGERRQMYESDITQCDKSHTLFNLLSYFNFLRQFGAPEDLIDIWSVMIGRKTASAGMIGLLIEFFEQLLSGAFHTISLNSIVVALAFVNSLKLEETEVVSLQVVGDDTLVELVREIDLFSVTETMRDCYNFESKTYKVQVPYFCGRYYTFVDGYWFLVKDPIKSAEAKGRFVSATADLDELFQSYVDDMCHYDKKEVLDQLAMDVAVRNGYRIVPRGLIRGLASYRDRDKFVGSYGPVVELVA